MKILLLIALFLWGDYLTTFAQRGC